MGVVKHALIAKQVVEILKGTYLVKGLMDGLIFHIDQDFL